jgi:hypothetical protein
MYIITVPSAHAFLNTLENSMAIGRKFFTGQYCNTSGRLISMCTNNYYLIVNYQLLRRNNNNDIHLSTLLQDSCVVGELTRLMALSLGEPIPAYSRREQTSYRYGQDKYLVLLYYECVLLAIIITAVTSTSLWLTL